MAKTEMLIRLRDLHEELSAINDDLKSIEKIDDETIESLGQLVSDVSVMIDRAQDATDKQEAVPEQQDLRERVLNFEAKHPSVTKFLSQITDILVMLGI